MHEVSIMQNALDLALAQAAQQGAQRIHWIKLRVGELSGVIPEALILAFEIVTANTIAADAELELETVPVICRCPTCHQDFHPDDWIYICPICDQLTTELSQGRELELTSLEVS
ncbi:MAG: hydrogenase maturation nickel metallochaperone HypA [Thermosynechococcaceae cyanobacterium]